MPHIEILWQYGLYLEEPNTLQGLKDCNPVSEHDDPLPSLCSFRLFLCCSLGSLEDKGVLSSIICTTEVFGICVHGLWGRREKEKGFFFLEERVFGPFLTRMLQLTAVHVEEEDVASRTAREGSSEGIHPLCLQCRILPPHRWECCHSWIPPSPFHPKQSLCCDWMPWPTCSIHNAE